MSRHHEPSLRWPVSCLAVDFGGTLAVPGPRVTGAAVAAVLRDRFQISPPDGYVDTFDGHLLRARNLARTSGSYLTLPTVIAAANTAHGLDAVPPQELLEVLFEDLPDATVDPQCGEALRQIASFGIRCLLACDTQRTLRARTRTLVAAGIADLFDGLVLSSEVGVRKPHPHFYARVLDLAGCPPEQVLFVGDTPAKDVSAPRRHGMQAALVSTTGRPAGSVVPEEVPVLPHFRALPALLSEAAGVR